MNSKNYLKKENTNMKKIFILGDSIVKFVNGKDIAKELDNCKVFVRPFKSATTRCMKDHIKPSKRENPDHCILHVGTNDISSDEAKTKSPEMIAKSITDVASKLKSDSCEVSISGITIRKDNKDEYYDK